MKDDVVSDPLLSDLLKSSMNLDQAQNALTLTSKGQGRPLIWLDLPYEDHTHTLVDQLGQTCLVHLLNWTSNAPADIAQKAALLSSLITRHNASGSGHQHIDLITQGESCLLALFVAQQVPDQIGQLVLHNPILPDPDLSFTNIAARSLILIGTQASAAAQTSGQRLKANLRSSHLIYIHQAGDWLGRTQPDRTSRVMIDFLNRGEVFLVREN
ncbi:MAG: hypothetical protein EBY21_04445 [Alphaproteobacteria bacterium]|nr:hypothetical protein [Alphaproteobacteria bacterium]